MRALVLGSGGVTAVAWELGVLRALEEGGGLGSFDLVLGTSAGAFVAPWVALGRIAEAHRIELDREPALGEAELHASLHNGLVPSLRLSRVHRLVTNAPWVWAGGVIATSVVRLGLAKGLRSARLALPIAVGLALGARLPVEARQVLGALASLRPATDAASYVDFWRRRLAPLGPDLPATVAVVAVDAASGELVVLDARSGSDLPTAVAASAAIPLITAPVPIGEARFLDGATISATNADSVLGLLPGVTEVLILAPADHGELAGEVERLQDAGVRVRVIRPSALMAQGMANLDHRLVVACIRQGELDAVAAA